MQETIVIINSFVSINVPSKSNNNVVILLFIGDFLSLRHNSVLFQTTATIIVNTIAIPKRISNSGTPGFQAEER